MSTSRPPGADGGLPSYPLRVFRVAPGARHFVRTLSARYYGLFTHFLRGRSLYCEGDECLPAIHRTTRYWKGYFAGEVYSKKDQLWLPVVLEITEHLELDLRHRFARGQVWDMSRLPESKKKREPVQGTLLETLDERAVPPAFSIVECLQHLYHRTDLDLNARNPLPDRVVVTASRCITPPRAVMEQGSDVSPATICDPDVAAKLREYTQSFGKRGQVADQGGEERIPFLNGKPQTNGNGKHS